MVSALRNNQELQSDLREAEVVTFLVTPRHLIEPRRAYRDGTCGGTDNQDCLREALRLYKADTDYEQFKTAILSQEQGRCFQSSPC